MKKFMTDIKTLAALFITGAAFTACSSSDDSIIDEQPVTPAKQTYTLTVKASKGGGDTTRALTLTGEGNKTLKAYWDGTETVTVKEGGTTLGTLTVTPDATDNTQATLSGELDAAPSGTALTLELFSDAYNSQNGTLAYIANNCDYATATTTVTYDAVNKTITGTDVDFTNQQAIIKFMLKDKANDAAISPSALTVTDGTSTVSLTSIPASTYTANGDGVLYVAFPAAGSAKTIKLTATVGTATYIYQKSSANFTNGQYYAITVKMTNMLAVPLTIEALKDNSSITVSSPKSGMKYSTDGGITKTAVSGDAITLVKAGDKVQFYGNGTSITKYGGYSSGTKIGGSGELKVYGNIMSLVNEENFATATTLTAVETFSYLFQNNTYLTDASGLLLPATTLKTYCYDSMFESCTNLTAGPTLPATTLAKDCYHNMFYNCTSLTSLTCLAKDISASYCIMNWLNGVTTTGTLYVDPSMTGASWGISSNWTVKSVAEKP